jgi:(1->4)-alpha-D-glucan 1-alpha-D-glucosylmutase
VSSLRRLAQASGIGLRYHDIWGNLHDVPDATLRTLLAAMGIDASTEAAAGTAVEAQIAQEWRQCIEPMIVVREHAQPWRVRLYLPSRVEAATLRVRCVADTGGQRDASVSLSASLEQRVIDGTHWHAYDAEVSSPLDPGYYAMTFEVGDQALARTRCAVVPRRCYRPPALRQAGARAWGVAAQLYGVRSRRNWGIGDFTDVRTLIGACASTGAGIVGLNPLHALFPHNPLHVSPYSPSSRLFVNPLYLDVEAVENFAECDAARMLVESAAFRERLAALRASELVDYPGVAAAKHEVLERLFASFQNLHQRKRTQRAAAFEAFRHDAGEPLRRHALFEALQEHFFAQDPAGWGWPAWPEAYRDPEAPEVARFERSHARRIDYYAWLQWQCDLQRAAIAEDVASAGVAIGVYTDLAVSIDPGGAEAWARQDLYAKAASVGAPPDAFNREGQDWGLPPIVPGRLRAMHYEPFLATLRANMRHAGALRIDHVMGLMRLFWVPRGGKPADGAYVHYPFDDLAGLVALESHRHRCMVIGEDLGTVPDDVRRTLQAHDVLSYRVLMFERDDARFRPSQSYPEGALATASTHDLPTLRGWWEGYDIGVRKGLGMIASDEEAARQRDERRNDRDQLVAALDAAGALSDGARADAHLPTLTVELAQAIVAFLASTPSVIAVLQLEDMLLVQEQANVPGTIDEHPNWRRKLPAGLEDALSREPFAALAAKLSQLRPAR